MTDNAMQFRRATRRVYYTGSKNECWKGGKTVRKDGRVMLYAADHPYPSHGKYVYRYRLEMEKHLGRYLTPDEVVHHINGINNDDRIENLQLMTNKEHSLLHGSLMRAAWARNFSGCVQCGTIKSKHKGNGLCTRCHDRKRWPQRRKK